MKIDRIPEGMTPHDEDSAPFAYPPGVDRDTLVEVVIQCNGKLYLYRGPAQTFGWSIQPAVPTLPGLEPVFAPITHYRICPGKAGQGASAE
jgi:hypothetical protein